LKGAGFDLALLNPLAGTSAQSHSQNGTKYVHTLGQFEFDAPIFSASLAIKNGKHPF
jgi:hypothetical protein